MGEFESMSRPFHIFVSEPECINKKIKMYSREMERRKMSNFSICINDNLHFLRYDYETYHDSFSYSFRNLAAVWDNYHYYAQHSTFHDYSINHEIQAFPPNKESKKWLFKAYKLSKMGGDHLWH